MHTPAYTPPHPHTLTHPHTPTYPQSPLPPYTGYPSDDINKFLWMVRIGGGVFPDIQEKNYLTPQGAYRVDAEAGRGLTNSLMYRLSYYRYAVL